MKDIKFRAWWKPAKAMCCVKAIDFHDNKIYISCKDVGTWCEINEVELMQYTGFKDIKGVDLYEGDLVNVFDGETDYIASVFWNESCGAYEFRVRDKVLPFNETTLGGVEIIGSIHEDVTS